jgi:tripartite-type tricarboxylate transporter receptor subunit TctC
MANAKPNGYTIGLIANAIGRFHWEGQKLSYKTITPLVMYNVDPAGFQVGPSKAHIKTFKDAIADMKKGPKSWNLAGGGRLGTWHMSFIELALKFGIDPNNFQWIAAGGAAPSLTELAAGGVDLAPTSLPEAKGLMGSL